MVIMTMGWVILVTMLIMTKGWVMLVTMVIMTKGGFTGDHGDYDNAVG